ncbi:MAG TPA: hypothetical protein VF870_02760 [Ignavibacteriaceae bacterium]
MTDMASLIPGFEYDIFISYRQKDNKYDNWVSEFVDNLKKELEATFKEEISVYFDINPHDGLLETHDVDESLKEKLKCLVFIPIISRTYCDPKSFAWEHEFKAFVEQASQDQFGLKIKLPNGNVANRVLPIRIYDLDNTDIKLCEAVLGGVLRGVEFIYHSQGVNRPLRQRDDDVTQTIKQSIYRDQINKVANAVKEIILGLKAVPEASVKESEQNLKTVETEKKEGRRGTSDKTLKKTSKRKLLTGVLSILVLISIILIYPKIYNKEKVENSNSGKILDRAIEFYDFMNRWDNYHGKVHLTTAFPGLGLLNEEIIEIQTKEDFYQSSNISGGNKSVKGIQNGECFIEIDNNRYLGKEQVNKLGKNCTDIQFYKEHHYHHFGLLMELKTSGLILENKISTIKFQGFNCLALTFTNDPEKVNNVYYNEMNSIIIYLDPSNYSMKGYKITGSRNLYAVCSGILNINGIKMPLCKTYFNSSDNSFLFVDLFSAAN